jgi:hypothetical protein
MMMMMLLSRMMMKVVMTEVQEQQGIGENQKLEFVK